MCKGPATCSKSAKDMKHWIGFLLHMSDLHPDQRAVYNSEKSLTDMRIPPAEAKKWRESLNNLINSHVGCIAFTTFLKSEFSEENIAFWMACEEYKKTTSSKHLAAKARKIYDQYVEANAPNEVNLDLATREETRRNLENPSPFSFVEAQKKIFHLMEEDSYRRFLKSKLFLDIVEHPRSSSPCRMKRIRQGNTFNFGHLCRIHCSTASHKWLLGHNAGRIDRSLRGKMIK